MQLGESRRTLGEVRRQKVLETLIWWVAGPTLLLFPWLVVFAVWRGDHRGLGAVLGVAVPSSLVWFSLVWWIRRRRKAWIQR
jgi:hypothetical protein